MPRSHRCETRYNVPSCSLAAVFHHRGAHYTRVTVILYHINPQRAKSETRRYLPIVGAASCAVVRGVCTVTGEFFIFLPFYVFSVFVGSSDSGDVSSTVNGPHPAQSTGSTRCRVTHAVYRPIHSRRTPPLLYLHFLMMVTL